MKSKQKKYEEAVERSILGLRHAGSKHKLLCGKTPVELEEAKIRLGIRKTDNSFDSEINSALHKDKKGGK